MSDSISDATESIDLDAASDAEVEHAYSPSQFSLRPLDEYLSEYREISSAVAADDLKIPHRPLLIYIHGGYWQQLSAADSLFNASDAERHHVSLAAIDYSLAPVATIDEMVRECINEICSVIDALQPTRVVVAGCSAGAHLAAMSLRDTTVSSSIDGAVLLSGIFDVRPLVRTTINDPLRLTEQSARDVSPMLCEFAVGDVAVMCAAADHDPPEFIRQNAEFSAHLRRQGVVVTEVVIADRDHFNLPYDLLREDTTVGDWVLSVLKG